MIAKNYGDLHYLGLSGGEPFVRKDLHKLVQPFFDFCNLKVLDIPSNFYYTDNMLNSVNELAKNNPNSIIDIQLSIDQTGEKHDQIRKVKGLYEKAMHSFLNLEKLRNNYTNIKLKVNIVYLDENKDDIFEIVKNLKTRINYNRVQLTYPHSLLGKEEGEETPDPKGFVGATRKLNAVETVGWSPYAVGLGALKSSYAQIIDNLVNEKINAGAICEAGKNVIIINEKGDVFPCEPLWKPIGNLRECEYDLRKIVANDKYKRFVAKHLGPDKCSCTWSCSINSAIAADRNRLPDLALNAVKIASDRLTGYGTSS